MQHSATPQRSPMWHTPPACESPRGFTLVELLAVIMIIAMLAALVTPAVMRALASARNAAIKAEIDMLHMAIMNYKNEYGSFPPLVPLALTITGSDAASRHLLRIFPRVGGTANAAFQVTNLSFLNTGTIPLSGTNPINPTNALPMWLYGYTDDPTQPIFVSSSTPRKKLFDFDASRLANIGSGTVYYHVSGRPSVPYVYINSANYGPVGNPTQFVIASGTYRAQTRVIGSGTVFFNADSFQILCAGRNEVWSDTSDDDLSNFWPGTRQDYLDSLRN
jgi:prepilin-type N-terminal cleavage/methylation domain-containing protein